MTVVTEYLERSREDCLLASQSRPACPFARIFLAVARRHRVIVVPVKLQRQGGDAGGGFVTGIMGRRRQRHERRRVRLHTLGDRGGMAARPRLAALGAVLGEPCIERVETPRLPATAA